MINMQLKLYITFLSSYQPQMTHTKLESYKSRRGLQFLYKTHLCSRSYEKDMIFLRLNLAADVWTCKRAESACHVSYRVG